MKCTIKTGKQRTGTYFRPLYLSGTLVPPLFALRLKDFIGEEGAVLLVGAEDVGDEPVFEE